MSGLISSGKTLRVQEFRTSGTWTNPGVKTVELFMVGGGQGGNTSTISGQGGNVVKTKYDVSGLATCAVVIGAGGATLASGGETSFDGVAIAKGGAGGGVSASASVAVIGMPGGFEGFGGHGAPGNGLVSVASNGAHGYIAADANTGAGGGPTGAGGSGYLRVEWYE